MERLEGRNPHRSLLPHLETLPASYLNSTDPSRVAADLRMLRDLQPCGALARGRYLPETKTVEFAIGTHEQVTSGVFHKLTGALTSLGLQVRLAQIHTLADGLVLDRFWTSDPDFAAEPPAERIDEIDAALVQSLLASGDLSPRFRQTRRGRGRGAAAVTGQQPQVTVDNGVSGRYTVLDVFAHDRAGLLYAIARTLFELDLSVARPKIATFLDQVVDVFYVTDRHGGKIEDDERLQAIRRRLLEVIQ